MNAAPHALATALAHARLADSVSAKRREGTGPHKTTPNGVLLVGDFPIHSHLSNAREAARPSEAEHATAWMANPSTIEGIDFHAEIRCTGTRPKEGGVCPANAAADYIVRTCSGKRLPMCTHCRDADRWGYCSANARSEPHVFHFSIVEVLR